LAFFLDDVLADRAIVHRAGLINYMATTNTMLQLFVSDELRGRVMSFYTMSFIGIAPLGALMVGYIGDIWGAGRRDHLRRALARLRAAVADPSRPDSKGAGGGGVRMNCRGARER